MVGLGNPGGKYRVTRHNQGRLAIQRLVERSELIAEGKWPDGYLALAEYGNRRFLALIPETFMNNSGRAVAPVLKQYRLSPRQVVLLYDDIDISLGEVRVKHGGGTGGHLGVASVAEVLGDPGFSRVRIGIGRPPEGVDPAEYVLAEFLEGERRGAEQGIDRAVAVALDLLTGEGDGKE